MWRERRRKEREGKGREKGVGKRERREERREEEDNRLFRQAWSERGPWHETRSAEWFYLLESG